MVMRLHMQVRDRLMEVPSTFYAMHAPPYDRVLIISSPEWSGIGRWESVGASRQRVACEQERAEKFAASQDEIQQFTAFLQAR